MNHIDNYRDDVEWDDEQEQEARQKVEKNSKDLMPDVKQGRPVTNWLYIMRNVQRF